jgi:hypothetical protein
MTPITRWAVQSSRRDQSLVDRIRRFEPSVYALTRWNCGKAAGLNRLILSTRSYGSVLKCYDQRPKAFARGRNLPIAKRGPQWPMLAFLVTITIFF